MDAVYSKEFSRSGEEAEFCLVVEEVEPFVDVSVEHSDGVESTWVRLASFEGVRNPGTYCVTAKAIKPKLRFRVAIGSGYGPGWARLSIAPTRWLP
jgi:hypothetical protein